MRPLYCLVIALLCCAATLRAEDAKDAEEHRAQGIAALQASQTNPREVVKAARHFAKAAAIFEKLGDADGNVEMNSFLYWCKKKMNLEDIEAFTKGGEAVVTEKLKAVDTQKVEKTDAQTWYDRAETFAKNKPDEHLLIAIRFFEVADRFKGTDISLKAQSRSLDEQQLATAQAAKLKPAVVDEPRIGPAKPVVEAATKAAVPEAAKLKDAEKIIKDIFKDEFAKKSVDEKKALGQKLLQQAGETKDDPATRYVLLKEAAASAAAGVDAETVLKALDALGQGYDVDALALKGETLAKIVPTTADKAKALARVYLDVINDAVVADNYDAAIKLIAPAEAMARKAQDVPLATQLMARGREVRALQTDFVKVKTAMQTLKDKPDDPDANLAYGRFLCFARGQWADGLPLLAKYADGQIKKAAETDLRKPTDATELVELADLWFAIAAKMSGLMKQQVETHATDTYRAAHANSTGLLRSKLDKKLLSPEMAELSGLITNLDNWKLEGTWKKIENGFEASGSTKAIFNKKLPAEFLLELEMNVVDGMRPRIEFKGAEIAFNNEGYNRTLWVYGSGAPEPEGKPHNYVNNKPMQLRFQFTSDSYEFSIDSKTVAKGKRVKSGSITLTMSGGDGWSAGTTRFTKLHFGK